MRNIHYLLTIIYYLLSEPSQRAFLVRATGLEPARFWQWNLNPPSLPIPPCPHFCYPGILSFSKIFVNSHPACLSNMMKKSLTMCPRASKITVVWCMSPGLPISDRAYFILHYRHFGRVSAFIAAWRFCYDFSQFWAFLNNFTWGQTHTPGRNF